MEKGQIFGLQCRIPLGYYDPDLQLLRMSQQSLVEDWMLYLEVLPKSGMMRNGKIYEQATWVRHTGEKGCGLWPTPMAQEGPGCQNLKLTDVVNMSFGIKPKYYKGKIKKWPTPQSWDAMRGPTSKERNAKKLGGVSLQSAAKHWPTPTAQEERYTGEYGSKGQKAGVLKNHLTNVVQEADFPTQRIRLITIKTVDAATFHTVAAAGAILPPFHDTELAYGTEARRRGFDVYMELRRHD